MFCAIFTQNNLLQLCTELAILQDYPIWKLRWSLHFMWSLYKPYVITLQYPYWWKRLLPQPLLFLFTKVDHSYHQQVWKKLRKLNENLFTYVLSRVCWHQRATAHHKKNAVHKTSFINQEAFLVFENPCICIMLTYALHNLVPTMTLVLLSFHSLAENALGKPFLFISEKKG